MFDRNLFINQQIRLEPLGDLLQIVVRAFGEASLFVRCQAACLVSRRVDLVEGAKDAASRRWPSSPPTSGAEGRPWPGLATRQQLPNTRNLGRLHIEE
jgi:hypothetical protein